MLLKFGAACRSRARLLGKLHGLAVEPAERLLLKIVIEEPQAEPLVRVRIPFGRLDQADADQVVLGLSGVEYEGLAKAEAEAAARRRSGGRRRRGDEPLEQVLTARTKIECRDGEIGQLVGIVVDPRSGEFESIILPMGVHVLRDVIVPAKEISGLLDDRVTLHCDMNDLAEHPSLRA
jgi:hypothetical protein